MSRVSAATEAVTIVRGREAHLRNLVDGIGRGEVLPAALHVVVMGGPDPTADLPPSEVPVVVHRCEPGDDRLPLARARNTGVAAVGSANVVLLDVDCIPGRDLIASYERLLVERDVVGMGEVRYLAPNAAAGTWTEEDLVARSAPHPVRAAPAAAGPTDRHELFWSLSFAVRTATYAELGGFDEGYVGYGAEDTDLGLRIRDRGVPLWWVPGAVAYHQHHATYDPPLQHLEDIVVNARRFHEVWGLWPMVGWLRAFADAGYVRWAEHGDELEVLRLPTARQIAAARRDAA